MAAEGTMNKAMNKEYQYIVEVKNNNIDWETKEVVHYHGPFPTRAEADLWVFDEYFPLPPGVRTKVCGLFGVNEEIKNEENDN